ncbi:MAG TPA: sigma-70 family RNA polymerase sigma factor [Longimicrobiales bacterium]
MLDAAEGAPGTAPVTALLSRINAGDAEALDRLVSLVYDELRRIAHALRRRERPDHTIDTTALIHEAYLRLVDQTRVRWRDRAHFYGVAALAMRRVLVNYAEARRAAKRGGGAAVVTLDESILALDDRQADELLALDQALTRLRAFNPRGARVVEYRFFAGLSHDEIADLLGVSGITVRRAWDAARAWLRRELGDGPAAPDGARPADATP